MKKKYIIILLCIIFVFIIILVPFRQKKQEKTAISQKEGTYLTNEELIQIEMFLEDEQNNSFLYCEYQNPREINLTDLLSQGAKISKELSENQKEEYNEKLMQSIGTIPQVPLVVAVKKHDIYDLIKEKTGEEMTKAEIGSKLNDWIFVENGELYVKSFTGNRYAEVDCKIGTKEGDKYVVEAKLEGSSDEKYVRVTLKKQEDTYLFVSNEIIE